MSAEVIPPGFETLSHILAAASQDEVGGKSLHPIYLPITVIR